MDESGVVVGNPDCWAPALMSDPPQHTAIAPATSDLTHPGIACIRTVLSMAGSAPSNCVLSIKGVAPT
jgi:hypothetical protein